MSQDEYSLAFIDVMIGYIEGKIINNSLSPSILAALQKRLDAIEAAHHSDPEFDQYYAHMLELQTLIYGESHQEAKALEFLKEAVRQTGSARGLYSKLLREYIATHARVNPVAPNLSTNPAQPSSVRSDETPRQKARIFGKLKFGLAAAAILAIAVIAVFHFVPRASALPVILVKHTEISRDKQLYVDLTAKYQACSADLAQRKSSVNPNDLVAVDAYNKEAQQCQDMLKQQQQVVEAYDSLMGLKTAAQ